MPANMSSGDRKVLLIAGVIFLILVVLGFLLAPSGTEIHDASSYSTASEGAKAAYLLLQESGYRVERWERPASELKADRQTVLIIADPATFPNAKDKTAVDRFISGGGRVITNGIAGAAFLPEDFSEMNPIPTKPWKEFAAVTPSAITRAAQKITLAPVSFWKDSSSIALYGSDEGTVAARLLDGGGDAIWLASATPLTNAGLKEPGNLEFLLAVIGDKQQTRVLFDEYVHGYGEHKASQKRHPLMTALLLQSIVLAAAALFTFSRRSGPLRPMAAESRSSPLEFVETLGGLYQQAHAASVAVDVYYQRFQFWITRRLGLAKDASAEEIDRAVRERWRWHDDEFVQILRNAASARYHPDLPQNQALEIVQALHSYAVKLKLFSAVKERN
jgi:Domain of unknown function (DUF4350)